MLVYAFGFSKALPADAKPVVSGLAAANELDGCLSCRLTHSLFKAGFLRRRRGLRGIPAGVMTSFSDDKVLPPGNLIAFVINLNPVAAICEPVK